MSFVVRRLITRSDAESEFFAAPVFRNTSGSATIGVSGSPATIAELSVATGYHLLLPLHVSATPSGLGTAESATINVVAVLDDESTVTLATRTTAAGSTSTETFTIDSFDFSAVPDNKRITTIRVTAESSATATSATLSVTIVALQLSMY